VNKALTHCFIYQGLKVNKSGRTTHGVALVEFASGVGEDLGLGGQVRRHEAAAAARFRCHCACLLALVVFGAGCGFETTATATAETVTEGEF
jgi:hypothetical protein